MRPVLLAVALAVALFAAFELLLADFWWRYDQLQGVLSLMWLAAAQAACIWWAVSTWRWLKTRQDGQCPSRSVRLGLLAFPFVAALMLDYHFGVQARSILAELMGELPPMTIKAQGDRLVAEGAIFSGSAAVLERRLDEHPNVRVIELSSPGGYVKEAVRMANMIEKRGLDTLIRRECRSACVELRRTTDSTWLRSHRRHGAAGDGRVQFSRLAGQDVFRTRPVQGGASSTDHPAIHLAARAGQPSAPSPVRATAASAPSGRAVS
jgi:hypothetical protein